MKIPILSSESRISFMYDFHLTLILLDYVLHCMEIILSLKREKCAKAGGTPKAPEGTQTRFSQRHLLLQGQSLTRCLRQNRFLSVG